MSLGISEDVDADARIDAPPLTRRDLWSDVVDAIATSPATPWSDALEELLADVDGAGGALDRLGDVVDDDELAWRLVDIAMAPTSDKGRRLDEWIRSLGRPRTDGLPSSLDDVLEGPIALLDAGDVDVTIAIGRPDDWETASSTERSRWLRWVTDLSAGIDVVLDAGVAWRADLLNRHRTSLPSTTVVNAETQTDHQRAHACAADATESLGRDAPAWRVLGVLVDEPREVLPLERLQTHVLTDDVDRTTNSKRVTRLEEVGLVDRVDVDGRTHVQLLPAGAVCWRDDDMGPSSSLRGITAHSPADGPRGCNSSTAGVNDPPNSTSGPCTPTRGREDPPGDRPAEEGDLGPAPAAEERPADGWMDGWHRMALDAVAPNGGVSLVDEPLREDLLEADRVVSVNDEKTVVTVSIRPSSTAARTATRLAAALLDDRVVGSVLDEDRLGADLDRLEESNSVVLRLARQIGWLPEGGTTAKDLRARLSAARQELLSDLADVGTGSEFDPELAGDVTRRAQGLAGVATHLLDLAGVRVVRELRGDWRSWSDDGLTALVRTLATQVAITTRYGHYPLYRVMLEDRDERREAMLGAPAVDPDDPTGEVLGGWVMRGPGADLLAGRTRSMWSLLDVVDEDRRHFARFVADVTVRESGREEVAAAASRVTSFKRLEATREAVSLLDSLTTGPFATARGLYRIGAQDVGRDRELCPDEVRLVLGGLDEADLLDELGGAAGAILQALATADGPLSTSVLADRADVDPQTIRNRRDELEALGLLEATDLGAGRATEHSLVLADRAARGDEDAPLPELVDDEMMTVTDAAVEVLTRLGHNPALDEPDKWREVAVDGAGTILDLVPDGIPDEVVRLAARLTGDVDDDRGPPGPREWCLQFGESPDTGQQSLPERRSPHLHPGG